MLFLSEQGLVIYLFSFQYISGWAMLDPFSCNLGIFDILYTFILSTSHFLNIHVYDVLLIKVIQFWDVTI